MDCSLPCSSVSGNFRKEYWSGLPFATPGDLTDPWMELALTLLHWQVDFFLFSFFFFLFLSLSHLGRPSMWGTLLLSFSCSVYSLLFPFPWSLLSALKHAVFYSLKEIVLLLLVSATLFLFSFTSSMRSFYQ